jgi:hypothetical protein
VARDAAWAAEFHRRMEEFDSSHGIGRAAAAPLRPAEEPHPGDSLGLERAARQQWESSAALRVEFGDSFERYLAFFKADNRGAVKIISRKA